VFSVGGLHGEEMDGLSLVLFEELPNDFSGVESL
jgi:hypothetical protein